MIQGHRHFASGHEHEFEPQHGLPEPLPARERLLWQGSPDWRHLARSAFHLRKIAIYFGALLSLRGVFMVADGAPPSDIALALLWLLPLPLVALGLIALIAWMSARTTVYTITDRRVVMRIGIVLTLTFNIPFKRVAGAGLKVDAHGRGDIPLQLAEGDRIAWLHLWPHSRPWHFARPEPMLRSVPDAARVARLLSQAWSAATGQAANPQDSARPEAAAAGAQGQGPLGQSPALAGR